MKREQLLTQMRRNLKSSGGAPAPPRWTPPGELFIQDADARQALLIDRLAGLGANARVVDSRQEAQAAVEQLMGERAWRQISCPADLAWPSVADRLGQDEALLPFGLVEAEWALAETGTVVILPGGRHKRVTSLLPPAVGFIVRRSRILSRLTDVLVRFDAASGGLPANVVFVSGPSRSADIGSVVCRGVHGPGEVHVWVIESE